jgi:hypothetical protein
VSREFIYSDIACSAGDVRLTARDLEYHAEQQDEAKTRESLSNLLRSTDRLRSHLSSLDALKRAEREAEELRRNPLPPTLPLPFIGGAS